MSNIFDNPFMKSWQKTKLIRKSCLANLKNNQNSMATNNGSKQNDNLPSALKKIIRNKTINISSNHNALARKSDFYILSVPTKEAKAQTNNEAPTEEETHTEE